MAGRRQNGSRILTQLVELERFLDQLTRDVARLRRGPSKKGRVSKKRPRARKG